jgi:hypothetical protein
MASPFIARTKQAKKKLTDNRTIIGPRGKVRLECGHHVTGFPAVSNPDRWWCCGGWRTKR